MNQHANQTPRKTLLVVMDGVGETAATFGNAVRTAWTPNLNLLKQQGLFTTLFAHGTYVGLPSDADIGNSEVGHNALGAGRIFDQGAKLVQRSIDGGVLFKSENWKKLIGRVTAQNPKGTLHFIGLLSDGNVHSHEQHLYRMMEQAVKDGVKKIRVHVLFDGRDVAEKSAEVYAEKLLKKISELKSAGCDVEVASGGGRMFVTMDRYEADWSIVERGWKAHVLADAPQYENLTAVLKKFREDPKLTDQNFPPFVIAQNGKPTGPIIDGDAVVFYNFRGDRAIEISRAFTESHFTKFDRKKFPNVLYFGMMEYDGDLKIPNLYLVSPPEIDDTMGEYLVSKKLRQFACSETQKYGHVTYFWNGNRSGMIDPKLEEYLEIASDVGISFDEKPWMKAEEICEATIARLQKGSFDFGRINFANGDMVGHTGNFDAAVEAVATVDLMIGKLIETCAKTKTILVVTADHGNADEMFDAKEKDYPDWKLPGHRPRPKTAHTLNPVPFVIFNPHQQLKIEMKKQAFGLGNVANTVFELMGIPAKNNFLESIVRCQ